MNREAVPPHPQPHKRNAEVFSRASRNHGVVETPPGIAQHWLFHKPHQYCVRRLTSFVWPLTVCTIATSNQRAHHPGLCVTWRASGSASIQQVAWASLVLSREFKVRSVAILAQAISCSNVHSVFSVHERVWFCLVQVSTTQFCSFPFLMARVSDGTNVPISPAPASSSNVGSPNGSRPDLEGTGFRACTM